MERTDLVKRFFDEFSSDRPSEDLDGLLTNDVILTSPQAAGIGRVAVRRFVTDNAKAFLDLNMTVDYVTENKNRVAARVSVRGQHANTYAGIRSSHRRISMPFVFLFELRDNLICGIEVFYDLQLLTSEIGNGQLQPLR